jgi:site-specific DNA-cytosine methylase
MDKIAEPQCMVPKRTELAKQLRRKGQIERFSNRVYVPRQDGICNTVTHFQKDTMIHEPQIQQAAQELKEIAQASRSCEVEVTINGDGSLRPYNANTKAKDGISEFTASNSNSNSNTVIAARPNNVYGNETQYRIRKLTPVETGRLMGLRDNEIQKMLDCGLSNSAMYKLHGNSIVVDVLYHVFRTMFIENQPENAGIDLFNYDSTTSSQLAQ